MGSPILSLPIPLYVSQYSLPTTLSPIEWPFSRCWPILMLVASNKLGVDEQTHARAVNGRVDSGVGAAEKMSMYAVSY